VAEIKANENGESKAARRRKRQKMRSEQSKEKGASAGCPRQTKKRGQSVKGTGEKWENSYASTLPQANQVGLEEGEKLKD